MSTTEMVIEQSIGTYYGDPGDLIRFFAIEDGKRIGEMYIDMDRHIIMQIEVDEDRRGEGIATALYEAAAAAIDDLMHAPEAACTLEGLAFSQAVGGDRAEDMDELADYHDAMAIWEEIIMESFELDAWLGDTEATDEQRYALMGASDDLEGRWDDDPDADREAFNGAAMMILGDTTPAELVAEWDRARRAADEAHARMTGGIVAYYQHSTELGTAEAFGLSRQTIRKALGTG